LLKRLLKFLSARPVATGAVTLGLLGTSVGAGVLIQAPASPVVDGTANVWMMAGTGSCTRQATPVTFAASASPDARCGSMQEAYDASTTSDLILVSDDGGSFPGESLLRSGESQAGPMRTFREATGETWTITGTLTMGTDNGQESGNPPSYVTYDGMTISNGSVSCIWGAGTTTDITITNSTITDTSSGGDLISCGDTTNFTVTDSTLGPLCCAGVAIGQGKASGISPGNENHLYQDLTIYGLWDTCLGVGGADPWPTEYGSCSGYGFGDWEAAGRPESPSEPRHIDGIQLVDCDNCTVDRVSIFRLLGASSQGLFVHSNNSGTFANLTVKNTMIAGTRQGGFVFDGDSGLASGTFKLLYNSSISGGASGFLLGTTLGNRFFDAGTSVIVVGNVGPLGTSENDCVLTAYGGTTITPTAWANLNSARTCFSDENGSATFVSTVHPYDLRLQSGSNGVNEGDTTYCGSGKEVDRDLEGTTRFLGSACDRGADEKE
jgi:hypothetical protein